MTKSYKTSLRARQLVVHPRAHLVVVRTGSRPRDILEARKRVLEVGRLFRRGATAGARGLTSTTGAPLRPFLRPFLYS